MSITFDIIPAAEVPEARGSQRRRKPDSPIDIALAAFLREHPEQWVAYPVAEFWPDKNPRIISDLRTLATRVCAKFSDGRESKARKTPVGPFIQPHGTGRFLSRIDHDRHRVLVSFTREDI